MEKLLSGKTCERFTAELASPVPVPGGGGVTALLGALSAALCAMAANITRARAEDPAVGEALADAAERAEVLRRRLISLIDADAEAFLPLSRAYGLPKDAPGRAETLRRLSLQASEVPLEMLRLCGDVAQLLEQLLTGASRLLLSDVGCAAAVCRAAVECAAMNVRVNTRALRDDAQAREYERETETLYGELTRRADAVANSVRESLMS